MSLGQQVHLGLALELLDVAFRLGEPLLGLIELHLDGIASGNGVLLRQPPCELNGALSQPIGHLRRQGRIPEQGMDLDHVGIPNGRDPQAVPLHLVEAETSRRLGELQLVERLQHQRLVVHQADERGDAHGLAGILADLRRAHHELGGGLKRRLAKPVHDEGGQPSRQDHRDQRQSTAPEHQEVPGQADFVVQVGIDRSCGHHLGSFTVEPQSRPCRPSGRSVRCD